MIKFTFNNSLFKMHFSKCIDQKIDPPLKKLSISKVLKKILFESELEHSRMTWNILTRKNSLNPNADMGSNL